MEAAYASAHNGITVYAWTHQCVGSSPMRSEPLYSTEQAYIEDTTEVVELYQGAFLQMFRRGETVLWGDRHGHVEWTNFPPRRPDGVWLPDITGLIKLDG